MPHLFLMLSRFLLTMCRFAMAAWVGAAVLFVVTSVIEQSGPNFDSVIRDHLALLRFPYYYYFGFTLVGGCLLSFLALSIISWALNRFQCEFLAIGWKKSVTYLVCSILAIVLMTIDYIWIYQPLVDLITPAGSARTAEFVTYHNASKYINEADLTLCLIAALAICWPTNSSAEATE